MATAQARTEMVVTGVTLTLNHDEAKFLRDLMGFVGGAAATTRRKHADNIADALSNAGVKYSDNPRINGNLHCTG